ncbi:MAG TPA: hypothetical protein VFG02_03540 [Nitrospirota bacterium]|nr:hypothetical protein [Nitrospirota bacterium]
MTGVIRKSVGMMFVILLALPSWTFAADDSRPDTISGILQSSSLSKTEKTEVQGKAVAAINAGVPAEDVEIIVSRSIRRGADAATINRFLDTSISMRQQGLPVAPVLDRIEQGLSKGVPPERIAVAAQQLASKITVAQPIVDDLIRGGVKPRQRNERETAIEATARALEKSIPAEDLKKMGASVRERKGSLPLFISAANTAAYFAGSGMSSMTSSHLVQNAVEKGYTERDLDGMVKQIANQMRRGTRAEEAAHQMEREGMQGGRGMEQDMGGRGGMGPGSSTGGAGGMGGHRK